MSLASTAKPKKLTNKERAELTALPARIEALEAEQAALVAQLGDPNFYRNEAARFAEVKARLDAVEAEHAASFGRWGELEALATGNS